MRKKLGGAYPRRGADLREGAYQNLDSKGGANPREGASLREGVKPNKYGKYKWDNLQVSFYLYLILQASEN